MAVQGKGKGGQRKHGREGRRPSHTRYNSVNQRDRNKRKRILRSNGKAALKQWESGDRARFYRTRRGPTAPHHRKGK